MHVAIDLGSTITYLACWDAEESPANARIKVKLPGVAELNPAIAPVWGRDNLHGYISYIYREYLLPSRKIIESAALSVPDIFSLNQRRLLLDICEEILGLPQVMILPHYMAMINGYHLAHDNLKGDILVIDGTSPPFNFAFLSIIDEVGITLEHQSSGNLPQLVEQAKKLGYLSPQGWKMDFLLLLNDYNGLPEMANFIAALPAELKIIKGLDLSWAAVEGLSILSSPSLHPCGNMSMIYPYQFYLQEFHPELPRNSLRKIPFDTCNLELNWNAPYRLLKLNNTDNPSPASETRVVWRIYEINTDQMPDPETLSESSMVLEIDTKSEDLPPYMELILDMEAAHVRLDLPQYLTTRAENIGLEVGIQPHFVNERLYELLRQNQSSQDLVNDWDHFRAGQPSPDYHLAHQVDSTLFHLYGLLQLWRNL